MIATVRRRLAHSGRNAGALQGQHALIGIVRLRPATDEIVESVLVRQAACEITEAAIVRPLRVSRDLGQRTPGGVREAGDGEPPIVPRKGIDVVRCRRLVGRAVSVA
jgi:hypothetical protein